MGLYRKKPVVVAAHQWFKNGDHPDDYPDLPDQAEVPSAAFRKERGHEGSVVSYYWAPDLTGSSLCKHCRRQMVYHGWIKTLEGGHIVCPGDWIITGVQGERYPCKPDIFDATYEPVESDSQ
jgi:hypothetical protein